ncbi:MAG: hypothetical protein IJX18_01275 [Clostridia bacterium]|nr:hypothetical protein [Clostridia bacterium]
MTYGEAKKIALNYNQNVNACREYDKGYNFYEKSMDMVGGNGCFVVIKETGKVVSMPAFIAEYAPNPKGKSIQF